MLNIKASSANHDSNIFFTTYFQGKSNYVALATHTTLKSELYDQVNSFIINEILLQDFENSMKDKIEEALKDFFVELNWKLYAKFRQTNLPEHGISLILTIVYDNDIYLVQFGRMLCCTINGKKLTEFGRAWDNFHVKSKNDLFLLGSIEDNIHVKVLQTELKPGMYLVCLPSTHTDAFGLQIANGVVPLQHLSNLYSVAAFPYFTLGADIKRSNKKKSLFRRKKFRITLLVAVLLITVSILYVKQGNNFVQEYISRMRLLFKHQNRIQLTHVLDNATPKLEKQIKQIERVAMAPARAIGLKSEIFADLSYSITAEPQWDIDNIYLINHNRLIAFDKKTHAVKWEKQFGNELLFIKKTEDKSLLVMEKNKQIILIRNDGKEAWNNSSIQYKETLEYPSKYTTPYEITYQEDARLNGSVLVFKAIDLIYIVNSLTGEMISKYRFSEPINFISSYDPLDHCFYLVIDRSIVKLTLDIKSW
jgi:hypothetical protein